MEIELNAKQTAALAKIIAKHPDKPVTLRAMRRNRILAEVGFDATILPARDPEEGGDAA
jgi:hypothetical protein